MYIVCSMPISSKRFSISAIFGIGFFALPAGLLATGFSDEMKKEKSFCPHCGEKLSSD